MPFFPNEFTEDKTHTVMVPITATDVARTVFIADGNYRVKEVNSVFSTASTSGTVTVGKAAGTALPSAAVACLTATLPLTGTVNTVRYGTVKVDETIHFQKGDRLCVVFSGTLTSLVGGFVQVVLERVP